MVSEVASRGLGNLGVFLSPGTACTFETMSAKRKADVVEDESESRPALRLKEEEAVDELVLSASIKRSRVSEDASSQELQGCMELTIRVSTSSPTDGNRDGLLGPPRSHNFSTRRTVSYVSAASLTYGATLPTNPESGTGLRPVAPSVNRPRTLSDLMRSGILADVPGYEAWAEDSGIDQNSSEWPSGSGSKSDGGSKSGTASSASEWVSWRSPSRPLAEVVPQTKNRLQEQPEANDELPISDGGLLESSAVLSRDANRPCLRSHFRPLNENPSEADDEASESSNEEAESNARSSSFSATSSSPRHPGNTDRLNCQSVESETLFRRLSPSQGTPKTPNYHFVYEHSSSPSTLKDLERSSSDLESRGPDTILGGPSSSLGIPRTPTHGVTYESSLSPSRPETMPERLSPSSQEIPKASSHRAAHGPPGSPSSHKESQTPSTRLRGGGDDLFTVDQPVPIPEPPARRLDQDLCFRHREGPPSNYVLHPPEPSVMALRIHMVGKLSIYGFSSTQ